MGFKNTESMDRLVLESYIEYEKISKYYTCNLNASCCFYRAFNYGGFNKLVGGVIK